MWVLSTGQLLPFYNFIYCISSMLIFRLTETKVSHFLAYSHVRTLVTARLDQASPVCMRVPTGPGQWSKVRNAGDRRGLALF